MKDINIRWKSYPHYLPKIRLRRRRAKSDLADIANTDGAGSSRPTHALKPVADIPVYWRDEGNPDRRIVPYRDIENAATATGLDSAPGREISYDLRDRAAERIYDPRIAPSSRTLVRSAKSTATQLGNFRPNVTTYRDGQIGKISVQKNRQSLRTISRYSSHSKARRSAAPSIQSVVRSVLSTTSSRSPSQRKALAQFTKDLARYAYKTKQLPSVPNQGLIESPSTTTISVKTIKELEPYRAQFVSAGLAITSKDQKTAGRFSKPSIRQLDGRRDTQYDPVKYSVSVAGGKRIKSVLKKKQPSFASGSTGTTVIGFTPPHEKSLPRGQQPKKASSLSSDHTVVGFTPPHEKFRPRKSSRPRSQVIVRTTRQQENYSPATPSRDDTFARSLVTSSNDHMVVTLPGSPERFSPRPASQRTDRSFVVPVIAETMIREDTASPAYTDEVDTVLLRSQRILKQERYLPPEAGSAETIVITRPQTKIVRQARYVELSPIQEPMIQSPVAQQRTVQQPRYAVLSSPNQRQNFVGSVEHQQEPVIQQTNAFVREETARVLPLRTGFAQRPPPMLVEKEAQGRYVEVEASSVNKGMYGIPHYQAQPGTRVQERVEYYVEEGPPQTRYIQTPTQPVDSQSRIFIQNPALSPETAVFPTKQTLNQERLFIRQVEDPFVEASPAGSKYVQETSPHVGGQYYYVKDSTAQQKLVLVPDIQQSAQLASEARSNQGFGPVDRDPTPPEQYIGQAIPMPEDSRAQRQYFEQSPNSASNASPSPGEIYSRGQVFRSPPRTAVKKSLPWLRQVAEPELQTRILGNEQIMVVDSRNEIAQPMTMSGPYPVAANPQVTTLTRGVRAQVTFSDDVGMETDVVVNNQGTSTNVQVRQTPPSAKGLLKLQKSRSPAQREIIMLEPNDRGGRLLNAPERRGSRASPVSKAAAVVQTERLQIERNRRVAPRDANNVDDLEKIVITQSFPPDPAVRSFHTTNDPSRVRLVSDNSTQGLEDSRPGTNKLLPFVLKRTMVRDIGLQEEQTVDIEDSEIRDVILLDSETGQVLSTVGKAVVVKRGLTQMNSMRGLIVEDSTATLDAPPTQPEEERKPASPNNRLPRAPGVWGAVDWTKQTTVRDAEEEERELLAPSQVPSPQIPYTVEERTVVQEVPVEPAKVEVVDLANYEEVMLPEELPSQTTQVEIVTLTDRGNEARDELQISVSTRAISPQAQIAIPPRNPRRSQVRWLGDRNVQTLPIPSSPPSPLPPRLALYADRGMQSELPQSPEFRDRATSAKPVLEVRDRSTSIRPISGIENRQGLIRRRTHACTSGSFHCAQCHMPSPTTPLAREAGSPIKTKEESLEEVLVPEAEHESQPEPELKTELESQPELESEPEPAESQPEPSSLADFANPPPIPDPAKRSSLPQSAETPSLPHTLNTDAIPPPGFDVRVFKGWHVATAAASDEKVNTWIEKQTGVNVRKFLVDLSVFDGVEARGVKE